MKKRKGQVLILILLVVVVALAVGLSVASRNLTNLRTTTQTEQSQKAFNAAEGAIEKVLADLQSGTAVDTSGTTIPVPVGDLEAAVTVVASKTYEETIGEGSVGQVDLGGASGDIQIEWSSDTGDLASLMLTEIFENPGGSIGQSRYAWSGASGRTETGFIDPLLSCSPSPGLAKCGKITLNLNSKLLRIRPLWNQAAVKVSGVGAPLSEQIYTITSSAKTELGLTRKIQVVRTAKPQLPAAFDYALYSEGDIKKE